MEILYVNTSKGRLKVVESIMSFGTVERFFELYGYEAIEDMIWEKYNVQPDDYNYNCFSVDSED